MTATVLVVEDELKIRELVRRYLERADLSVLTTGSGAEALTMLETQQVDLIVLDLNLPDVSGESIAAEVRSRSATPILMLTAKSTEADRIRGLELGADDYLTKPFSPRELVLRVQAVLRRSRTTANSDAPASFGAGTLVIDEVRHDVIVRGRSVELTPTEWALLIALTGAPGRMFSRAELINRLRGYQFEGYERTIDAHVKNLRRKIEPDHHHPRYVQTVQGVGYRLAAKRE
jgi:Response regulators consisting of a CheY-like receiver domain and a winged-helix DNA-binding domain